MNQSDIQIIQKAKSDPQVFESIYEKYWRRVYSYIYHLIWDKVAAEDLAQETFLRAYKYLPKFKTRKYSYLKYLLKIAQNVLNRYLKQRKKIIPAGELDIAVEDTDPALRLENT